MGRKGKVSRKPRFSTRYWICTKLFRTKTCNNIHILFVLFNWIYKLIGIIINT